MAAPVLRPYDESLARPLFEAARESTAEVHPWLPWCRPDYTLDDAVAFVEHAAAAMRSGKEYEFAIVSSDGRFLGGCGLNAIRRQQGVANLGYWVRTSARGHGIAPEAVRLLATWAREHTDLQRIEVLVPVGNAASIRVAEKAGAAREGIWPDRMRLPSGRSDAVVFSIVLEAR